MPTTATSRGAHATPSFRAGVTLGVGLGGFVDGILLHQIVHWHNMGSAVLPPDSMPALQANMRWDGLFHAAAWTIAVAGTYLLLHDGRRGVLPSPVAFTGQLLMGWGLFNLVEGLIDHHILQLHHVHDLPIHLPVYDWLFLGFGGVGLLLAGWSMNRMERLPAA
jgi:uncharacterized membrane protein